MWRSWRTVQIFNNFRHLTGDSLAIAKKHGIELKNPDYVQIHPTTFYTKKHEDRSFLISESVRGEGAKLLDKNMNRFVDELLPRDVLTGKIREQMKKDGTDFVWEDLRTIQGMSLYHIFQISLNIARRWDMMSSRSLFLLFRHSTISWAASR